MAINTIYPRTYLFLLHELALPTLRTTILRAALHVLSLWPLDWFCGLLLLLPPRAWPAVYPHPWIASTAVLISARGSVSARSLLHLHRGLSHETASTPSAFSVMVGGQLCGLWGWVLVGVAVHRCRGLDFFTIVCLHCGIRGAAECWNFSHVCILWLELIPQ